MFTSRTRGCAAQRRDRECTWRLCVSSILSGDLQTARQVFERLQTIGSSWERMPVIPALIETAAGNHEQALARLKALEANYGLRHPFFLGLAYAWVAAVEPAVLWLRQPIESHDMYAAYIPIEPLIDPIRSDPRFREVWDTMPRWTVAAQYGTSIRRSPVRMSSSRSSRSARKTGPGRPSPTG